MKKIKNILNKFLNIPLTNLYYLLFLLPFFRIIYYKKLDNDFWFTINQGKYIINNGFPTKVINVIHDLDFIYQSYGTGIIFYLIYHYLGDIGIILFTIIIFELTAYFFYKLCLVISSNKRKAVLITIVMMIVYNLAYFTTRPHIFTTLNLTIMFYLFESYLKTNNKKYLYFLPVISLLEVNLHGIYLIVLLVIMSPYLINSFKFNILGITSDGYKKKPIIISFILMILVSFINPYGIKTIIYGLKSYASNIYFNNTIIELLPLNFHRLSGKVVITLIILLYIIYFKSKKKIPLRYYLFLIGTSYLAFDALKSTNLFLVSAIFPLAYILNDKKKEELKYSKVYNYVHFGLTWIFIIAILVTFQGTIPPGSKNIIDYLDKNVSDKKTLKLYTDYQNGSYAEYRGYYCYIDPRGEVFFKINNHKEDIYLEYYNLQNLNLDYREFLEKYDFDYLLLDKSDTLYKLIKIDNYNYEEVMSDKNYYLYKKVLK